MRPHPEFAIEFGSRLLAWYRHHRRELPWRHTDDPYAIWVSETMLQQTQVATVVPYYRRFLAAFPTVHALAAAPEEAVLAVWAGLGYYSRARNLHRAARIVCERFGGRIPDDPVRLRELPGVGRYTAGAIASLAYGRPTPVVDGNVERVLARVFALRGDVRRPPLARELWDLAEALIPPAASRDFNSAMMELGATLCTPRSPDCPRCPVVSLCQGRAEGIAEALPERRAAPAITPIEVAAAVVWREERVLLGRGDRGRWVGLWQLPHREIQAGEDPAETARRALAEWTGVTGDAAGVIAEIRHTITRFRVRLRAVRIRVDGDEPRPLACAALRWLHPSEVEHLPVPTPHRRLLARIVAPEGAE